MKFNERNISVSPRAMIGANVRIGDNTVIYDNVSIGDGTVIANDCVLGEPGPRYYRDPAYVNPPTTIGPNSLIRSHAIIYSGVTLGSHFESGHRIIIREGMVMGNHCRVGTQTDLQGDSRFGNHCWLHSNVFVAKHTHAGNFVFIYPHVVITDDPHPPSDISAGATIEDFAQISAGSVLMSGVKIGKHSLVAANSLVMKDVGEYDLVAGQPAKFIKKVQEVSSRTDGQPYYPWPHRFNRGMPWAEQGFETWVKDYNPR